MPLSRVFGVWLLTAMPLLSQNPAPDDTGLLTAIDYETARLERVVTAVRITEEISLDGVLDEPAWELASPAGDFHPETAESGTTIGRTGGSPVSLR